MKSARYLVLVGCIVLCSDLCRAQVQDTAENVADQADSKSRGLHWKRVDWILPASLITVGSIIATDKDADEFFISNYEIWEERNEKFINFSATADNYLQYTPAAAAFILSASGVPGRNDLPNQIALFAKSELLMLGIVYPLKRLAGETRPDTGRKNSFPSGHTAQAFVAATFFSKEYGYKSVWYSVGAYTIATTVGVFRILNNRHWISDIMVGAGIGILSTNFVYATHKHRWGHKKKEADMTLLPFYERGSGGMYLKISL